MVALSEQRITGDQLPGNAEMTQATDRLNHSLGIDEILKRERTSEHNVFRKKTRGGERTAFPGNVPTQRITPGSDQSSRIKLKGALPDVMATASQSHSRKSQAFPGTQ
ncbi:hypothetical protein V3C99_007953 [Haemonchus contortus]|uniref:Uncharacterized protein n=1 Tax=Haemonchus contortus TaxID=6289 RepID=A0A7I4YM51_HAECO